MSPRHGESPAHRREIERAWLPERRRMLQDACSMKHLVHHGLGQERAKQVADSALKSYADKFSQYSPRSTWVSPTKADISFNVKGMTLNGALEIRDKDYELDLDVPFLLRPFKGTAMSVIEQEIQKWVSKAKSGEV
jgi:hypothetical protein